jgi:prolipoprotein diacylglyceryl transferase
MLVHSIVGTIIGARLVHGLFYEPDYYLSNPLSILKVWEGGLASHGALIGIVTGLYVFARKNKKTSFWWCVDFVAIVGPVAGGFIRLGNLMNSEIYGKPTNSDWGVVFLRLNETPVARHPAQVYEAIVYFGLAALTWIYYRKRNDLGSKGAFGLLLAVAFGLRFLVEFFKENQEAFDLGLPVNMGQLLSLPFFVLGVILFVKAMSKPTPKMKKASA